MLFMDVWTWEPENRDEVERRATEWKCPEGMTVLGEWVDLTGRRVFLLYEVENTGIMMAANHNWTDIAKVETTPVMTIEEVMKLMPKG